MSTYRPPSIDSTGLSLPSYGDILDYLVGQFQATFGAASYLGNDSADFQDIAIRALQAYDFTQALQLVYLSLNPQTAIGKSLDLVGKLIGTPRKVASFSTAVIVIAGAPGTVIAKGLVRDINGNYWALPLALVIPPGGSVSASAICTSVGSITANPGDISIIATPTAGWTGAVNTAAATPGNPVEPDSAYRARLLLSQSKPSLTLLNGTVAAVAAVPGVTRSAVYENPTGSTDAFGNPPHSITCVVEGGVAADIAQAIYKNRGIGCLTNGSTSVTVADPLNPAITMPIAFDVLTYASIYVVLSVHALAGFTNATQAAIASAVVDYINSVGIGQAVVFSELYGAALSARPDPDTPLFSIRAIQSGAAVAQTTGATTIGSPTVTVASAAGIANGQTVTGPGIPANTTITISGTTVTLSQNATSNAGAAPLSFFALGTTDIAIAFNAAAQGAAINVVVNLV